MHLLLPDHLPEEWFEALKELGADVRVSRLHIERREPYTRRAARAAALRLFPYALWTAAKPWLLKSPHEALHVDGVAGAEPVAGVSALLASSLMTRECMEQLVTRLPDLRWIHSTMTGVDRLDLGTLMRRGIRLTCSRGLHSQRIAEFAMGLIYLFAKGFPQHARLTQERRWRHVPARDVKGRTLAVLGAGQIGRALALLARANGMRAEGTSRTATPHSAFDRIHPPHETGQLLARADFIVLALPLTSATQGVIDREALRAVKPGAVLINVGRAKLVQEEPLLQALRSGRLAGAALESTAEPPLPRSHPLYSAPTLLFTHHSAYAGEDAAREIRERFLDNVRRQMAGTQLAGEVDLASGY